MDPLLLPFPQQKSAESHSWKKELRSAFTTPTELWENGLISLSELKNIGNVSQRFKISITRHYAQLMSRDSHCPIKAQALPHVLESDPQLPTWLQSLSQQVYGRPTPWHSDPIGDLLHLAAPRLTHRYRNRAILHVSSVCAVYCRFCFRKSHLNSDDSGSDSEVLYLGSLEPALEYLKKNTEIRELILTGGDPLSLTDPSILSLLKKISKIGTISTVRFHSRMAVTLPIRFTSDLCEIFSLDWPFVIKLVSHFNHPVELSKESKLAFKMLRKAGVQLLNQSVLLRGVNDTVETLSDLFQGLYENGVQPFYLHHPDWTPGTFHFRKSIAEGQSLYRQLRGAISGPALPDYVLDLPQGHGKVSLNDQHVVQIEKFHGAALYDIKPSVTRAHSNSVASDRGVNPLRYLDIYPTSSSPQAFHSPLCS